MSPDERDEFEDLFRDRLDDFEAEPPQDGWEIIAPQIKPKGFWAFWKWALPIAAFLLMSGAGIYWLYKNNSDSGFKTQDSKPKDTKSQSTDNQVIINNSIQESKPKDTKSQLTDNQVIANNSIPENKPKATKPQLTDNQVIANNSIPESKPKDTKSQLTDNQVINNNSIPESKPKDTKSQSTDNQVISNNSIPESKPKDTKSQSTDNQVISNNSIPENKPKATKSQLTDNQVISNNSIPENKPKATKSQLTDNQVISNSSAQENKPKDTKLQLTDNQIIANNSIPENKPKATKSQLTDNQIIANNSIPENKPKDTKSQSTDNQVISNNSIPESKPKDTKLQSTDNQVITNNSTQENKSKDKKLQLTDNQVITNNSTQENKSKDKKPQLTDNQVITNNNNPEKPETRVQRNLDQNEKETSENSANNPLYLGINSIAIKPTILPDESKFNKINDSLSLQPLIKNRKGNNWQISAYFEPIYTFRKITPNQDDRLIISQLSPQSKWSKNNQGLGIGLQIQKPIHQRWLLNVGLHYNQMKTQENYQYFLVDSLKYQTVFDSSRMTVTPIIDFKSNQSNASFQQVGFDVGVRYQLSQSTRLGQDIVLGLGGALISQKYLNTNPDLPAINSQNQNFYLSIGYRWYIAINSRWRVWAEPHSHYYFRSFHQQNRLYAIRPLNVGLRLGLAIRLHSN
jgi:hypothetical protein